MSGLIERIERADAPDREIDCEIYVAFHIPVERVGRIDISAPYVGWHPIDAPFQSAVEAPRYTASIDAAMTLVPEHLKSEWSLIGGRSWQSEVGDELADAATPALALCAAALKAKAMEARQGRDGEAGSVEDDSAVPDRGFAHPTGSIKGGDRG